MTTTDLSTLRAALVPEQAQRLWQHLVVAGRGGCSVVELGSACLVAGDELGHQLQAMQQAGLLRVTDGQVAANPAAVALLAAAVSPPVRAGLLIGRKNIEAVVSRDRKRRS